MHRSSLLPLAATLALLATACAPAQDRTASTDGAAEAALRTGKSKGADALLSAFQSHGAPRFLFCRTPAATTPALELSVYSADRMGTATVLMRDAAGVELVARDATLEGIPRAGDLQGVVTFKLGTTDVSFDYVAENVDDRNELTFAGKKIPLLCNVSP